MILLQKLKEALGTLPYDSLLVETAGKNYAENQYPEKIQGVT